MQYFYHIKPKRINHFYDFCTNIKKYGIILSYYLWIYIFLSQETLILIYKLTRI